MANDRKPQHPNHEMDLEGRGQPNLLDESLGDAGRPLPKPKVPARHKAPRRTDSYSVLQHAIEDLKGAIEGRARLIAEYKKGLKAYDEDIENRRVRVLYTKNEHDYHLKMAMADAADAMNDEPAAECACGYNEVCDLCCGGAADSAEGADEQELG